MHRTERLAQLAVEATHLDAALTSLRKAIPYENDNSTRDALTAIAGQVAQLAACADRSLARVRAELHDAVEA